jgi:hypothetical protein
MKSSQKNIIVNYLSINFLARQMILKHIRKGKDDHVDTVFLCFYIDKYNYREIVWWIGCDLGWLDQDESYNDI